MTRPRKFVRKGVLPSLRVVWQEKKFASLTKSFLTDDLLFGATPDELGAAWNGAQVALPLISRVNDREVGRPEAGVDLTFDFPRLIAHAARTRALSAGTVIGSGTVANRDAAVGSSCLAEIRMRETIEKGAPETPFLRFGDRVRIEMVDADGRSVFGAIDQRVVRYEGPPAG